MQILSKIKIGPFLVISSVLVAWMLLITQHVQAHDRGVRLPSLPSCSTIPDDTFFDAQADITSGAATTLATKRGTGVSGNGDIRYHYAKITIPALAAGELRVFDSVETTPSDAALCRGSRQVTRSVTSYTAHDNAYTAAATARRAAETADGHEENADQAGTDDSGVDRTVLSDVRAALGRLRTALNTAANNLGTAKNALNAARRALNVFPAANTEAGAALVAETAAATAQTAAATAYNTHTLPSTSLDDDDELTAALAALDGIVTALTGADGAADDLGVAADNLRTAATDLEGNTAAGSHHTGFKLRSEVELGDEGYVVIVAPTNTGNPPQASTTAMTLNITFHGVIGSTSDNIDGSLSAGDQLSQALTITAPGLLTVETTGSTDTMGTLDGPDTTADADSDPDEIAMAESGGSGGNFKIVAPVAAGAHTLYVEGQTPQTAGDYTLDMDFKIAMTHYYPDADMTNVDVNDGPDWGEVDIRDDGDTIAMIRPELDSTSDEDYFLFRIADAQQGFLTVEAENDASTAAAGDADTTGTLYGPMGEIATDSDSGAGSHFRISVPVETGNYIVKVTGSVGGYLLDFALAAATDAKVRDVQGTTTGTPTCPGNTSYEICAATSGMPLEVDQYTLPVTESGALYVHTEGSIDTVGILYGPDGSQIATDDNSGADNNFRIAANVAPGLYLLQVRGKDRMTMGVYQLVTSFVAGPGPEPPTEPTTPTDPDPDPDPDPEPTDLRGASLDNPPHNSVRSGVGIINGWVCQASDATITITISPDGGGGQTPGGSAERELDIAYGTARPDVPTLTDCTNANAGFGMAYNFNNLDEGQYRITARVDGTQIGTSRLFTVVHLVPGQTFPTNLSGDVDVPNFPTTGQTTTLEWETESQGFVITDVQ